MILNLNDFILDLARRSRLDTQRPGRFVVEDFADWRALAESIHPVHLLAEDVTGADPSGNPTRMRRSVVSIPIGMLQNSQSYSFVFAGIRPGPLDEIYAEKCREGASNKSVDTEVGEE